MAHLTEQLGTEVYDETEAYDRKHGDPSKSCDHKSANLTEASNKEPPQYMPMKIKTTK